MITPPYPADFELVAAAEQHPKRSADGTTFIAAYGKRSGVAGQYVLHWTSLSVSYVPLELIMDARGKLWIDSGHLYLWGSHQGQSCVIEVPGFVAIPGQENSG